MTFNTPAFSSEIEGAPQKIKPNSKYSSFDPSNLERLAGAGDENAPSPQGPASQGALGNPASAGETPKKDKGIDGKAALGDEGPQDMLSIFNQSDPEDRAYLTDQVAESYAPLGLSLEGGFENALMKGGPQAMARAAQFGIDLTPFANKINPQGADKQGAQAFGAMPTEEQSAGGEAFKSQDQAAADFGERTEQAQAGVKKTAAAKEEAVRVKKKEQREAIAAFLIEAGLRTIASNRDDAGGAMAEGALGTMEARAGRQRQAKEDSIAEAARKRKAEREDAADERARVKAEQERNEFEYKKSRRKAEEDKAARTGMEEIVNEDGETYYFDPLDPKGGNWVVDMQGNRIRSKDAGLSTAQVATNERAYDNAVNGRIAAIQKMDSYKREEDFGIDPSLTGEKLQAEIRKIAIQQIKQQREEARSGTPAEETDYLDWPT